MKPFEVIEHSDYKEAVIKDPGPITIFFDRAVHDDIGYWKLYLGNRLSGIVWDKEEE